MNADLRSLAGLGYPPKPYNQNANECMNSTIKGDLRKDTQGKLKMSEKDFVISLEKIVKRQETEVKLALIGKGEYRLKDEYKHLTLSEDLYWRKSVSQREAVFGKMLKEPLMSTMEEAMAGPNINSTHLDILDSFPSTTSTDINSIPSEILQSIFHDAKNISQTANGIVQMPGYDDSSSFFVINRVQKSDPFKVYRSKCASLFTCETKCHRYNSYKLCEHTIATSIYCDIFSDYIQKYKAKFSKLKGNLTAISLTGMPRNRGQKQKGTSVRKGKNNKTCTEVIDYLNPENPEKRNMLDLEQPFHLTFLAGLVKQEANWP
ncbi:uncharacterized protein LOC128191281 [Crassostrea angulata]|uniref:uncharacterized protein LOC128191281 n=1 Tax=Magallana angulata TaxID=2784310 RepID=UPI0022B09385|nr:uncharacterized protein LOC128191281 [Crassostrea angulata]